MDESYVAITELLIKQGQFNNAITELLTKQEDKIIGMFQEQFSLFQSKMLCIMENQEVKLIQNHKKHFSRLESEVQLLQSTETNCACGVQDVRF